MIEFRILYFNPFHYQHSIETITIPVAQLIGAGQEDIVELLDSLRKYNSMDCVYTMVTGHEYVHAFQPTLRKIQTTEKQTIFD